ncbi:hypothetical protein [Clostridium sp. Ade.TY]|uniref:hypothetical protein n=1 Tax=Clostridium sp. Ade.TY TaxID=1391647 RepID=UPI00040D16B2|nr:hypothetical protein [Clostridium sp. Ade.TY]
MSIRYMVQNDSMKPSYNWCYMCSFATLEDAKKFIEKEKKINSKAKYRIVKETTKVEGIL